MAGIEIGGKEKTVPCELKPVNCLRVQLADGRAALYVNEHFCLQRSEPDFHPLPSFNLGCHQYLYPDGRIHVSNVRIRRWDPPREEPADENEKTTTEKKTLQNKEKPSEITEAKAGKIDDAEQ
ncbi:MAG: hypothetical protein ACWGMZ_07400 [Thermoguttaceae bacterium]